MPVPPAVTVVCFGEILWDVLPGGAFLGGAPLNVAAHLSQLGVASAVISRVGADPRGTTARAQAHSFGVDLRGWQTDAVLPTGEARARLDASGSARYEFETPAAWDAIEAGGVERSLVEGAAALVFGSLAQRDPRSRAALASLLDRAALRVFDVNLRQPHHDAAITLASLRQADLVKLNEDECAIVGGWLGTSAEPPALLAALKALRDPHRQAVPLELCITLGERGALYWAAGTWHSQPAVPTTVVDTIGAGDSFLAMLLARRFAGDAPRDALARAARLASLVASRPGAVPSYDARQIG